MISVKRAYDGPRPTASRRFLIDRIWPRGVSRDKLKIEQWYRDVAPSAGLRKWFGHDPARWDEFKERYFRELEGNPSAWRALLEKARSGDLTLVYGAKDEEHNNAVALKEFLEARL